MIYKTERNFVLEYYERPEINNSLVKKVNKPHLLYNELSSDIKTEDEEKRHFRVGGALDILLTGTASDFESEYYICKVTRPGGKMLMFIDSLPLSITEESPIEDYQEAYDSVGYKWGIEKTVKSLWSQTIREKKNGIYFAARKEAGERSILSWDEYEEVKYASRSLSYHPFIKRYLLNLNQDEDIFYQIPIYYTVIIEEEKVKCKCMLDCIIVNHKTKTIKPIDYKSIGQSINTFKSSFVRNGYFTQAGSYTHALRAYLKDDWSTALGTEYPMKHYIISPTHKYNELFRDWRDYKVENLDFFVAETNFKYQNKPKIFTTSDKDIEAGMYGGVSKFGIPHKGFIDLLIVLRWHQKMNYWELPMEEFLREGKTELNVFQ